MASSRPLRKCARRLSQEAISGILDDLSDSADDPDDPDFIVDSDSHHSRTARSPTKRARHPSTGSSSTSTDSDHPSAQPANNPAPVPSPAPRPSAGTIITTVRPGFAAVEDGNITQHTATTHGTRYICSVKHCGSKGLSNLDGLWLFPLPPDKETRSLWFNELPIDVELNRPASPRVCFRHFDSSMFVRRQQRLLGLQKGAVPSANTGVALPCTPSNSSKHASTKSMARTSHPSKPTGAGVQQPSAQKPTVPVTKGQQPPPSAPIAGGVVASAAPSSAQASKPKTEIFIDLTSDEPAADVKCDIGKSQSSEASCGALKNGPTDASHAGNSSHLSNGAGPPESMDGTNEDSYELTLEDIEEELPWVVPDMHWDSYLDDSKLHLVWNNSPNTESCKKVVLDKDLRASVYVGEREVVLSVKKITTIASLKQLFTELGKL